jgi:F-type H+-transporting ATPase subunit b
VTHNKGSHGCWATAMVGMIIGGWVADVWAAQPIHDTLLGRWFDAFKADFSRSTFDVCMSWVNFIILAALIYKYAKAPVIDFLKQKKAETAQSIQQMEERKIEADAKILQGQIELQDSEKRLVLIKERIAADGQRRKAQIIEQARQESRRLLDGARLKIDSQIREAYNTLRLELIDMAAEKAAAKMPRMITENDQEALVGLWMDAIQK